MLAGCLSVDGPDAREGKGGGGGVALDPGCTSDGDCPGARCVFGAPEGCVAPACVAPGHCAGAIGETGDLLPCTVDAACASGSCAPTGSCRRLCDSFADCPTAFDCVALGTPDGGLVDSCVGAGGALGLRLCGLRDAPPCDAGLRCTLFYDAERTRGFSAACVADDPALLPDLAACTGGGACHGGICAMDDCADPEGCPAAVGRCVSPCLADADCRFPTECEEKNDGFFACDAGCLDRRGCRSGQLCAAVPSDAGPTATCLEPVDLLATGAPCRADVDCTSDLCVAGDAAGEKLCSELCNPLDGAASCAANGLPDLPCVVVRPDDAHPQRGVTACAFP